MQKKTLPKKYPNTQKYPTYIQIQNNKTNCQPHRNTYIPQNIHSTYELEINPMNKVILAVIAAGFGAQLVKLIIYFFRHKSLKLHDLIVTGGMPSSHSAFVVALSTIIYLEEGTSTAFAISLVLALIVLRDAFGVRRTVGEESIALNHIIKKLKLKDKTHVALGHTPLQVTVGSIIGFLCAIAIHFI